MNLKNRNNRFLWIAVILLYIIFIIRDILSIDIPQYLIMGLALIYVPFANYKNLISYCACLIPLITGMNVIIMLFILIALYIKAPQINKCQYIFLFYFIPIECALFYILPTEHRLNDVIVYSSVLAVFFFLLFDQNNGIDYSTAIRLFCYSGCFVLIMIFYRTFQVFGTDEIFSHRIGDVSRYDASIDNEMTVFSLNANNVGYFSVMIYACLLLGAKRLHIPIGLYWGLMLSNLLIAGLSVSRTWLFLITLLTIIYSTKYISKIKLLGLVLILAFCGGSMAMYFKDYADTFEVRLKSKNMAGANGRERLLGEYFDFMEDHKELCILGTGTVSYKEITKQSNSIHNMLQQMFVCTGIIGLFIFIIAGVEFYKMFLRRKNIALLYYLPMIGGIIFLQSIQFLNPYFLMLPICVAAMAIKMGTKNRYQLPHA